MKNKIDFSQFELTIKERKTEKNIVTVAPCIEFTIFLDMTDSDGIMDFYQRSLNSLNCLLPYYEAENMKSRSPINDKALTILPTWVKQPNYDRNYYLGFYGSKDEVSSEEIKLSLWFRPKEKFNQEEEKRRSQSRPFTSQLRVIFPVTHSLAEPSKLIDWISDFRLVKDLPFHGGHCGYAIKYDINSPHNYIRTPTENFVASVCLRYPGFYCCDAGLGLRELWRRELDKSLFPLIDRVNWLTLLNEKQIEFLGGKEALRKAFADEPSIIVHDLKYGIMIQAGEAPQIGDVGHRDFIPVYRKVAKALRPIRIDEYGGGFGYDETDEWLNGLDKEYD